MRLIVATAFALALAACSPPAPTEAPMDDMAGMSGDEAAPAAPIAATGTITAIDPAAGTVTISHGPITEVEWGPMTMAFRAADPALLTTVSVGDTVSFELKSAAEPDVLTAIAKQ